jgi:hypothetical protein
MKYFLTTTLLAALTALTGASADVTVKGEVVELACATTKGPAGRGDAHAACAMDCARKGLPMGLLVDEEIYEIAGDFTARNNAKLLDFVARKVEAKGELVEHEGRKVLNVSAMALVPPPKP